MVPAQTELVSQCSFRVRAQLWHLAKNWTTVEPQTTASLQNTHTVFHSAIACSLLARLDVCTPATNAMPPDGADRASYQSQTRTKCRGTIHRYHVTIQDLFGICAAIDTAACIPVEQTGCASTRAADLGTRSSKELAAIQIRPEMRADER